MKIKLLSFICIKRRSSLSVVLMTITSYLGDIGRTAQVSWNLWW